MNRRRGRMIVVNLEKCLETGADPILSRRLPIVWCSGKNCSIHKSFYGIAQWNGMNKVLPDEADQK